MAEAPHAAPIEFGIGNVISYYDHATGLASDPFDGVQNAGIIGAVHAGLHEHHAFGMERAMQRTHLGHRSGFGRVDAPRRKREMSRVSKYMRMAIARARGHVKINPRCRLRSFRQSARHASAKCSGAGGCGSHQNVASR